MSTSFEEFVLSKVPSGEPPLPMATYNAEGDCIEFFISRKNFYADRIDDILTVYRSIETDEIVGSVIKGLRGFIDAILDRAPGFKIEVADGRIKLEHLFTARLWAKQEDPQGVIVRTYKELRRVAEEYDVETEFEDACA